MTRWRSIIVVQMASNTSKFNYFELYFHWIGRRNLGSLTLSVKTPHPKRTSTLGLVFMPERENEIILSLEQESKSQPSRY